MSDDTDVAKRYAEALQRDRAAKAESLRASNECDRARRQMVECEKELRGMVGPNRPIRVLRVSATEAVVIVWVNDHQQLVALAEAR